MSVTCLCICPHPTPHFPPTPNSFLNPNKKKLHFYLPNRPYHLPTLSCHLNVDIAAVSQNKVLIAAGVSAAIGQISKPITGVLLYGKRFDIRGVIQAGGFPSTHSSAVVATATCLALERGFSDSIFGLSVVYASLVMYDAQGVRREVGIHAKTLNRLLLERQMETKRGNDVIDNLAGKSSSTNLGSSRFLKEPNAPQNEQTAATQLIGLKSREDQESKTPGYPLLKESIGHTEVEVIAGALLGFIVSLTVNALM